MEERELLSCEKLVAAIKRYKINLEVQESHSAHTGEIWRAYNYPNGASEIYGDGLTVEEAVEELIKQL